MVDSSGMINDLCSFVYTKYSRYETKKKFRKISRKLVFATLKTLLYSLIGCNLNPFTQTSSEPEVC